MKKVLILEDEVSIRSFVVINLKRAGYDAIEAGTGMEALERLKEHPDIGVAILDIMLPDIDGFEVCRNIRATNKTIGIIMLTARTQEMDKVTGLMTGADDYVTKPFNPVEVLARVRSQLRRYTQLGSVQSGDAAGKYTLGGITLCDKTKEVTLDGEPVSLTPKEYDILRFLMQNPGKVFSPSELYRKVWNDIPLNADNALAVHIRHLREKLEITPSEPRYLKVVWGKGYKMEAGT